jgi:hypothetical protein
MVFGIETAVVPVNPWLPRNEGQEVVFTCAEAGIVTIHKAIVSQ